MDCKECVFRNKKFDNNCSLLVHKNVSWDCTTTKKQYSKTLADMFDYYEVKKDKAKNNLEETQYRRQLAITQRQIDILQGEGK